MVRIERVFKEKDYKKQQKLNPTTKQLPPLNLEGISDNIGSVLVAIKTYPIKTSLTVIGAIAILYITFRMSTKFGKIRSNLKKI